MLENKLDQMMALLSKLATPNVAAVSTMATGGAPIEAASGHFTATPSSVEETPSSESVVVTSEDDHHAGDDAASTVAGSSNEDAADDETQGEWTEQKKKKQAKNNDPANMQQPELKHQVTILCDSVPRDINTDYIARKTSVRAFVIRDAPKVGPAVNHIQKLPPKPIIIHSGTNHIGNESVSRTIQRYERLEYNLVRNEFKQVAISSIVHRQGPPRMYNDITTINTRLAMMCSTNEWTFIDNDNIDDECLSGDGIHLNGIGDERLTMNFVNGIKQLVNTTA